MPNKELAKLYELKGNIESEAFQQYLMKPLYEELDKLKYAYQCESLKELATLKGKRQGLQFMIDLLKQVDVEIKNQEFEDSGS